MRRIVLDAQYSVMTSALTMALKQGGPDFQVQNAGPKTKDIVKLCRSCRADVLLLEVCPHPPRTLQDRLLLAKRRTMRQPPITNGSPLTIGSRGIVLREIPQGDIGRVRVDGLDWQARTVDGTPLPKDAHCEVKNVDGAVLIVSAVPVPAAAQPAEQLH